MSGTEKNIQLSIFNPFGEYFKILYNVCDGKFNADCLNKDFLGIITNECDDVSGNTLIGERTKVSNRFYDALKLFATNLRSFDSPISEITIKGQLRDKFNDAVKSIGITDNEFNLEFYTSNTDKKFEQGNKLIQKIIDEKDNIVNKMVEESKKKINFDMNENYGLSGTIGPVSPSETYKNKLYKNIDINKLKSGTVKNFVDAIFESWLLDVFSLYGESNTRFKQFVEEIVNEYNKNPGVKIEPAHKAAFDTFFEVKDGISIKSKFLDDLMDKLQKGSIPLSSSFDNYRINIKVVDDLNKLANYDKKTQGKYLQAGIAYAFPRSVRGDFNKALKNKLNKDNFDKELEQSANEKNFYKIKKACESGAYKSDEKQVKNVMNFIKNGFNPVNEPYVYDTLDEDPYGNPDGSFTIEEAEKDILKYKNTWAKDYQENLYTRLDTNNNPTLKWIRYNKERVNEDIRSFKDKDGNCGHLCIFEDKDKCEDFFNKMIKGESFAFEQLADMLNSNSFKEDYKKLRDNIVKVNPTFVMGTLKAFKFQKYEKLNRRDGTISVQVETFTRWWERNGEKFMNAATTKGIKPVPDKYHRQLNAEGKPVNPQPPENLELFLKLLVSFINNNEFVINPQSSTKILSNRLPTTTVGPNPDLVEPEFFKQIINGKEVKIPNLNYGKDKKSKESSGSLGYALSLVKKNIDSRPVNPGLPENRNILQAFTNLVVGIGVNGKFNIGKSFPLTTGIGYGYLGGSGDDIDLSTLGHHSRLAYEALTIAKKNLEKHNKHFKEDYYNKTLDAIKVMSEKENELYKKLILISKYEKVINSLDGNDGVREVTEEQMDDAVKEYYSSSQSFNSSSDKIISLIHELSNGRNINKSGYSDI